MRIAVINKTGGGMSGGYRKYLRNIIPRMANHEDIEAILCASPESIDISGWFDSMPNIRCVSCKPYRFMFPHRDTEMLKELELFAPDVIFVPVERFFRFKNVPVVNMIRNMEPLICPNGGNPISEILRNRFRAKSAQNATNKANGIIAVSKFVKEYLIRNWGIPSDKINMVYHGIDLPKGNYGVRPSSIPKNWDGRFLFTAGSIRPARGLEDLLFGLDYDELNTMEIPGLIISGEPNPNMVAYQEGLNKRLQKRDISSKICWTGSLNAKEMTWCYHNCRAFIMTSRVESFGMVGGEAMSHGCICISSNSPCLPELFGDSAVYYPSKDGRALNDAVQTVLTWDDNKSKVMSEKAKKQASDYSWDVCAKKTVAALSAEAAKR
jgi:glycosyltransferase involved in cell wall biosynthesis